MRKFIEKLRKEKKLLTIKKKVSKKLEAAAVMRALDGRPILFENVNGWKVVANLFSTRDLICEYFGIKRENLIKFVTHAIENRKKPKLVKSAPCQEIEEEVDLNKLPILFHTEKDGGPYITSGVVIAKDPEYGRNCAFHRLMQIDKKRFAIRLLPRHTYQFLKRAGGELDVAVVIGNGLNVLLASAISVDIGIDELEIANSLKELSVVRCKTIDVEVPAESEIVLEGRIVESEIHPEGPFLDLTETYDIVREQPILEVKKITRRKDAIYHALLPGGLEHKILMGLPREPTIFKEVSKVVDCKDVYITPGGCSWLHAIVKIKKKNEEDGKKAIEAAFKGHSSLKHVVVVDEDIDIYNPSEVEWAIATRFQAKDKMIIKYEPGSSLDPSADPSTRMTSKLGIDATKPLVAKGKNFEKVEFKKINLKKYLG